MGLAARRAGANERIAQSVRPAPAALLKSSCRSPAVRRMAQRLGHGLPREAANSWSLFSSVPDQHLVPVPPTVCTVISR